MRFISLCGFVVFRRLYSGLLDFEPLTLCLTKGSVWTQGNEVLPLPTVKPYRNPNNLPFQGSRQKS